ncbi:NAD(P)/FAD-dependent oxidoreductase [Lysinibacillus sp. SGAir0095]|uniref:FAD-dependent oxidoreductase n=1 Tax=Lysinibacillus sp. SGAir0095 TaxID=2070463 RepID=UPI0010CD1CE6|nr:NAD(P)/FAD-dependent oxidoreductase [Lysinibacillus sp. SGAir0095]QCR32118.1 monooxygenase [Lysinibacillus sp. SGAir0095]
MSTNSLRIAVIGGGIAGTAVANALKVRGIRADVYEQASEFAEVGAGIGLRPPSVNCFKKWDLYEALEKVTSRSDLMEIIQGDDQVLIRETWPVLTEDKTDAYARLIHRADVLDTLIAGVPEDQLHLNHRLTEIIDHGMYSEVKFANGNKIEADIVIAADGIRSPIRGQVLGQHEPVYSGYLAHRVLIPFEAALGMASEENILRIYVDGDNSFYLLPLENRNQVSVDITVPGEFAWRPELTKEEIMESIKGFGPTLQKIVENIKLEDIVSRPLCDLEPISKWSTKTITLIGDAAHAMLHNQGQGANMAIQDAEVLAEAISEAAAGTITVAQSLQKYEEQRKPITKLYQELSRLFPTDQAETAFPEKAHF